MQEEFSRLNASDESGEGPDPAQCLRESASAGAEARQRRILVVDDEKRIADSLCEILILSGFEARCAYDGWTALDAATRFHPDYLLCDVLMPRMNGVELAIAVRNILPAAKIVLLSGQVGISAILEAGQRRGYSFMLIAKPIHPIELIEQLRML
jgi:CheY-like chemotaxis protein